MTENESVASRDPLTYFNNGGVVIMKIPDEEIDIILQKKGTSVRVLITSPSGEDTEKFRKLVAEKGGHVAIVKDAFVALGVTQEIKAGSGVLQSFGYSQDLEESLRTNFEWPDEG